MLRGQDRLRAGSRGMSFTIEICAASSPPLYPTHEEDYNDDDDNDVDDDMMVMIDGDDDDGGDDSDDNDGDDNDGDFNMSELIHRYILSCATLILISECIDLFCLKVLHTFHTTY